MLLRDTRTQKVKIKVIIIDPWKTYNYSDVFDNPENVFEIETSDIYLPDNEEPDNMFSDDKIKSAYFLESVDLKSHIANRALIVQFRDSIYIASDIDG